MPSRRITYVGHWGPAFDSEAQDERSEHNSGDMGLLLGVSSKTQRADVGSTTAAKLRQESNERRAGERPAPMTAEGGDANAYWPSRHVQSCGGHLSDRTRSTLDSEHGGTRSGVAGSVTFPLIDRLVPWVTGVCLVVGAVQYLWSR